MENRRAAVDQHNKRWKPKSSLRYGLRTLLLVPVLIAAVLAWWVTWPQRSAARLINVMATAPDNAEDTSRLGGMGEVLRKYKHETPYLEAHSRSLSEILRGTQTFTVVLPVIGPRLNGQDMEFTATLYVTRGRLRGPLELNSRPKSRLE
jgi:hypothetical protein